jgi:hypothetical protein
VRDGKIARLWSDPAMKNNVQRARYGRYVQFRGFTPPHGTVYGRGFERSS